MTPLTQILELTKYWKPQARVGSNCTYRIRNSISKAMRRNIKTDKGRT